MFELLQPPDKAAKEKAVSAKEFQAACKRMALGGEEFDRGESVGRLSVEEFLVELCINPRVSHSAKRACG